MPKIILRVDNYHVLEKRFWMSLGKTTGMKEPLAAQVKGLYAPETIIFWKALQVVFWIVGIALLLFMIFMPPLGVTLFWNILIPVAPAIFVLATGFWRNVCPLGTTALLPDKLGLSRGKKLTSSQRTTLNLVGIIFLLAIIPLRHLLFNNSGQATAVVILMLGAYAIISGFIYERKSGWCSGICPVHAVEKLYGGNVAFSLPNAHCNECVKCSVPCPDSTPNISPLATSKSKTGKAIEILLVGGFPGYIWGWFQVPDYSASFGWSAFLTAYSYPILGGAATIILYLVIKKVFKKLDKRIIASLFASAAVSCYYWFRLPMLFGFSSTESNGQLIDLSGNLPAYSMIILNILTSSFFVWWMVIRKKKRISWSARPEYATHQFAID